MTSTRTEGQVSRHERPLEVALVFSPYESAKIESIDLTEAAKGEGVRALITATEIPGENNIFLGPGVMPLLADKEARFRGQIIAIVVADSVTFARQAAESIIVDYKPLPPVIGIEEAIKLRSFNGEGSELSRGHVGSGELECLDFFNKTVKIPAQPFIAQEIELAEARFDDAGRIEIAIPICDSQILARGVAGLLGVEIQEVEVSCAREVEGCPGDLYESLILASVAALCAFTTRMPVRVQLSQVEKQKIKCRHGELEASLRVGYDSTGKIMLTECFMHIDSGSAAGTAESAMNGLMYHLDSAYFLPHVRFSCCLCRTNESPSLLIYSDGVAFGSLIAEEIITEVSVRVGRTSEAVRRTNFYEAKRGRDETPYGQRVDAEMLLEVWQRVMNSADYEARRTKLKDLNRETPNLKRGIAVVPVKVGVGSLCGGSDNFSVTIRFSPEGEVIVGLEGVDKVSAELRKLITAFAQNCLGITEADLEIVVVGNVDCVAGDRGDLCAQLALEGFEQLRERLRISAARLLGSRDVEITDLMELSFELGGVADPGSPNRSVPLREVISVAIKDGVEVIVKKTQEMAVNGDGSKFLGFSFGAAVAEVLVDGFTGQVTVLRADILQTVDSELDPGFEVGRICGAFIQGMNWLSMGEGCVEFGSCSGDLSSCAVPAELRCDLISNAKLFTRFSFSASYCLSLSVREAIRDAVGQFRESLPEAEFPILVDPESVYYAIHGNNS